MKYVLGFLRFWYHFIVGDDVRLAVGVLAGLVAVGFAAGLGLNPWWLLPIVVAATLALSIAVQLRQAK